MISLRLSEAARLLDATLMGDDLSFNSVCTDSRNLQTGQLFVALSGPNFDGHNYLPQAQQAGAVAAMVQRTIDTDIPLLLVRDTLKGLGALASIWREKSRALVAAITGSNGKTTVKEMLAAIMARKGSVLATQGNLNNDIGLPLTLLRLQDEEYAVVEMGANHAGEINTLTSIAKPDVALITNAGQAHLEGFGSVAGVAKAKGEIINGLSSDGTFVVNADDDYASLWCELAASRAIVRFGFAKSADVSTSIERLRPEWRDDGFYNCFPVRTPSGEIEVELALAGIHNCKNALAAIAMAGVMGAGPDEIRDGLRDVKPVKGRLCPVNGIDGVRIIDDSYNANPDSVSAAIDVLTGMTATDQRSFLVLGELAEVGEGIDMVYQQLGTKAREAGVDRLYATGAASAVVTTFGQGGQGFQNKEQLLEQLKNELRSGDMVLVKGSRSAAMESVVDGISQGEDTDMLLYLAEFLSQFDSGFNVFQYLTLRAILGALTALIISFVVGPVMIRKLSFHQIGQTVRDDGPQSHLSKAGTPTMGGTLLLVAIGVSTLLWCDLGNRYVWVVLLVTLLFGAIGFYDDYKKIAFKDPKGLAAGYKYLAQSLVGLGAALFLYMTSAQPAETQLIIPFWKHAVIDLGPWFVLLTYFVIVGTSNAVNLTDGLDGLAIMPTVLVAGALGIFVYVSGHAKISEYLLIPFIPGLGEVTIFCGALIGSGLGFLWFNAYPAQVFMGDVGALALGAALGVVAVVARQELVLLIMGGVFVMETVSVILQVGSYKLTGRRIFRMAPLHHHFELKGWPEPRVIVRFWIITVILVLIGLASLKIR